MCGVHRPGGQGDDARGAAPRLPSLQPEEALLLGLVGEVRGPVGARSAADALKEAGFALSESTVSRLLRKLDDQGLTMRLERKGRVLTELGQRRLATLRDEERLRRAHVEALDITSLSALLDLLRVRRAVEREAARAAAQRATPEDVARLRELVRRQHEKVAVGEPGQESGMEFHRVVAEISRNRVLQAVSALVHGPGLDSTEALLDVVAGAHGTEVESVEEHRGVLDAIAAGDADRAEAEMVRHLDRLIEETLEFAATAANEAVVERLLRWMRSEPGSRTPDQSR